LRGEQKRKKEKEGDPYLVTWDSAQDSENPHNFSMRRNWLITAALGLMNFCVTFASSVFSTATVPVAQQFHVSNEVSTLGTSLFVLGFAVGPLVSLVYSREFHSLQLICVLGLGAGLGNLWEKSAFVCGIHAVRYLSNPCCCRSKFGDDHALPVLRGLPQVGARKANNRFHIPHRPFPSLVVACPIPSSTHHIT